MHSVIASSADAIITSNSLFCPSTTILSKFNSTDSPPNFETNQTPLQASPIKHAKSKCASGKSHRRRRMRGSSPKHSRFPIEHNCSSEAEMERLLATVPLRRKPHERQQILAEALRVVALVEPTPPVVVALQVLYAWLKDMSGNDLTHAISSGVVAALLHVFKFEIPEEKNVTCEDAQDHNPDGLRVTHWLDHDQVRKLLCSSQKVSLCEVCKQSSAERIASVCWALQCMSVLTKYIQGETDGHGANLKASFVRKGGLYALLWPANCRALGRKLLPGCPRTSELCYVAHHIGIVLAQAHKYFGKHSVARFHRANISTRRQRDYSTATALLDDQFGLSFVPLEYDLTRKFKQRIGAVVHVVLEDVEDATELLEIELERRKQEEINREYEKRIQAQQMLARWEWEKVKGDMDEALRRRVKREEENERRAQAKNKRMYGTPDQDY